MLTDRDVLETGTLEAPLQEARKRTRRKQTGRDSAAIARPVLRKRMAITFEPFFIPARSKVRYDPINP